MVAPAVAAPKSPELQDAFRRAFGRYSLKPLQNLIAAEGDNVQQLRLSFLRAMVFGLPGVRTGTVRPEVLGVANALRDLRIWNVFHGNAHACGFAATLLFLHEGEGESSLGARRLMERSVAQYIALVSVASHELAQRYQALLLEVSAEGTDAVTPDVVKDVEPARAAFQALVTAFDELMGRDDVAELAKGIATLLEAVLIVREKREEETALTLDMWVPLTASWPLFLESVNKGENSLLAKAKLLSKQTLLRALPRQSMDDLSKQLEDAAKIVGRGVCELELRDVEVNGKDLIRKRRIWTSHENAPLTLLYGLNWRLPDDRDPPDVRIVLQGNATVSIFVQGDPLFEYLLGYWSYVDLASKCETLAELAGHESAEVDDFKPTLYRVARFAHQLGYHNHGANIELVFGTAAEPRKRLKQAHDRWDINEIVEQGLPLPTTLPREGTPDSATFGRFAYVLALNDGLSTWSLSDDATQIHVHDYGQYLPVDDDDIAETWPARAEEMGVDATFSKGGRHRAAYLRSLWEGGKKRMVFCISQDGYIEVFVDGRVVRLR